MAQLGKSEIAFVFKPPQTYAGDFPMGSGARTQVFRDEGLVLLFVSAPGGEPTHQLTFTDLGFQRFAEFVAEQAAK